MAEPFNPELNLLLDEDIVIEEYVVNDIPDPLVFEMPDVIQWEAPIEVSDQMAVDLALDTIEPNRNTTNRVDSSPPKRRIRPPLLTEEELKRRREHCNRMAARIYRNRMRRRAQRGHTQRDQ